MFSQEVIKADPSLCSALGDMIFLLAAQAFEGDIGGMTRHLAELPKAAKVYN